MAYRAKSNLSGFDGDIVYLVCNCIRGASLVFFFKAINPSSWIPATTGFLLGAGFLQSADRLLPHLHLEFPIEEFEVIKKSWARSVLLVFALTLRNIPEGWLLALHLRGYSTPAARYEIRLTSKSVSGWLRNNSSNSQRPDAGNVMTAAPHR